MRQLKVMYKLEDSIRGQSRTGFAGFTLVELMIALAVLVILLAVGIPQSVGIVTNNRVTSQANELMETFSVARSEAIKRTAEVRVVPNNAANWGQGWTLVADVNRDGDFTDAGDVLRIGSPLEGGSTLTADAANSLTNNYVAFGSLGSLEPLGDTFAYQLKGSHCEGSQVRLVTVAATGRVEISRLNCP